MVIILVFVLFKCLDAQKLFQQHHLLGLPKLTCLDRIDIHSRRNRLTQIIGRVPIYGPVSSILININ